jgi:hypothetical protein
MIFLLAKQFSYNIALPCTISLVFMTYHIYLSQDGRPYSMLMFLGMLGFYFLIRYIKTFKIIYFIFNTFIYSLLFYTSYSSIPFLIFSQLFWLYEKNGKNKKFTLFSFIIFNGIILLFCIPWLIFLFSNYKDKPIMDPLHTENPGSLLFVLYGILHDWLPHPPLIFTSLILIIFFPILSKNKKNSFLFLTTLILPVIGINLFCKIFKLTHFISSRYFINFLPLFLITLFLSLESIEIKLYKLKKFLRFKIIFLFLFILSNLIILPLYYRSEKQDLRGLVNYLKANLRKGDNIYVGATGYIPAILYYFGAHPKSRHHLISTWKISEKELGYKIQFIYKGNVYSIYHSKSCCEKYIQEWGRLWIVVLKNEAKIIREQTPFVLKGFFDGSFLNFNRFPTDASMYLFLWDPNSPNEKGIDIPIE